MMGSHAHGVVLSQARAQAVATRLGNLAGITISVAGKAEADPLVPNTSEEN